MERWWRRTALSRRRSAWGWGTTSRGSWMASSAGRMGIVLTCSCALWRSIDLGGDMANVCMVCGRSTRLRPRPDGSREWQCENLQCSTTWRRRLLCPNDGCGRSIMIEERKVLNGRTYTCTPCSFSFSDADFPGSVWHSCRTCGERAIVEPTQFGGFRICCPSKCTELDVVAAR